VLNLWEGSFDATSSTPIFSQAVPVVAPTTTFIFYGTFTPSASWGGYAWVEVTYAASGVVANAQRYQLFTPTVEETQVCINCTKGGIFRENREELNDKVNRIILNLYIF
jgi:hypothetical protein